ncbi:hypothetical protein AKO1_005360 [Acrasis kona]|uniref:Uncharacterized protein n=1 Tax=Acrasis kona TaxID=1008807 RepID=A0AAW2YLP6_9EUKA
MSSPDLKSATPRSVLQGLWDAPEEPYIDLQHEEVETKIREIIKRIETSLDKPNVIVAKEVHDFAEQMKQFIQEEKDRKEKIHKELKSVHDILSRTDALVSGMDSKIKKQNEQIDRLLREAKTDREVVSNIKYENVVEERVQGISWYLIVLFTVVITICATALLSNISVGNRQYSFPPS